ncbi:MAG: hypothetical protein F2694_08445 [Actinobacteria bacterium]|uniref:Unannotated protein n=1 Tax=freshwater metagenome TaxID=449393 RepID=A0A6J6TUT4_9ZZZZ|nr:hypothetical protein [Actinomycetota bacterium]
MEFFGQFEHTIDDKGRMVLPSAYRSEFVDGAYVAFLGQSAGIFTPDGWDRYRRRIELSGDFDRQDMQVLLSLVSPVTPDSQHRVTVNAKLREILSLEREVTIVGSGTFAAIYDRSVWSAQESDTLSRTQQGQTLTEKFNRLPFL